MKGQDWNIEYRTIDLHIETGTDSLDVGRRIVRSGLDADNMRGPVCDNNSR